VRFLVLLITAAMASLGPGPAWAAEASCANPSWRQALLRLDVENPRIEAELERVEMQLGSDSRQQLRGTLARETLEDIQLIKSGAVIIVDALLVRTGLKALRAAPGLIVATSEAGSLGARAAVLRSSLATAAGATSRARVRSTALWGLTAAGIVAAPGDFKENVLGIARSFVPEWEALKLHADNVASTLEGSGVGQLPSATLRESFHPDELIRAGFAPFDEEESRLRAELKTLRVAPSTAADGSIGGDLRAISDFAEAEGHRRDLVLNRQYRLRVLLRERLTFASRARRIARDECERSVGTGPGVHEERRERGPSILGPAADPSPSAGRAGR
jgi:hypothetical protein